MSAAHGEQVRVLEEHGQQGTRSLNMWGMAFFVISEGLIFANLIAAFLYLEIRDGGKWVLPNFELGGSQIPAWVFPAGINSIILFSSSYFVHMAGSGIRKGNQRQLVTGLAVTIVLGLIFLSGQVFEYVDFISRGVTMGSSIQGSAFYTLTGFHGLHVTIGLIFLIILLVRSIRGDFTAQKHFGVEAGELYWHFVDGVWVFVYSVVYLLPLILRA
ncbi:MAG TPA: heme-copper oxidase subunit III [Ktedonobacteraceae bacterium]|nr:heme-copper oxidase subunit III [Ktedonobacteraceae bacterium]